MSPRPTRMGNVQPIAKGKRLAPEVRRAQILEAAARLIVQQGYLPLSMEELSRHAGTSKALIYAYFPTQYELFNALLTRELSALREEGIEGASHGEDFDQAVAACALLYFEHVARNGPLLNILMTDLYMAGHIAPDVVSTRDAAFGRLKRMAARVLPLPERDIEAAIEMMTAIPDESGRLAFHQELDPAVARQVCEGLIASSLKALRAPDAVEIPD